MVEPAWVVINYGIQHFLIHEFCLCQEFLVLTNLWFHHAVVDPPHCVQRHATVQVDSARHGLKNVPQSLGNLNVLSLLPLLLLALIELKRRDTL